MILKSSVSFVLNFGRSENMTYEKLAGLQSYCKYRGLNFAKYYFYEMGRRGEDKNEKHFSVATEFIREFHIYINANENGEYQYAEELQKYFIDLNFKGYEPSEKIPF